MADGEPRAWGEAPDLCLDFAELGDALEAVFGDRCGAVAGNFKEFAPGMGPTIGQLNGRARLVGLDQAVVTGITIDLQDSGEAFQYIIRILATTPRRIDEGHARRGRTTLWPIIAGQGSKVSDFGLSRLRIKPPNSEWGRGSRLLPGRRMQGMLPRGHEHLGGSLQIGDLNRPTVAIMTEAEGLALLIPILSGH